MAIAAVVRWRDACDVHVRVIDATCVVQRSLLH